VTISFKLKNTGRSPNYILAGEYEFAISADFPPIFSGSRKDIPQLPGIIRQTTESQIKVAELPIIKETDFSLALRLKHQHIGEFCEAHGVNLGWLLEGEGEMFKRGPKLAVDHGKEVQP
jgi:hypothetical protein